MIESDMQAGDLPTEHESALEKFMIVLEPSWDIERINQEIQWHLDRPQVMQRKALEAFAYARRYLTNTLVVVVHPFRGS